MMLHRLDAWFLTLADRGVLWLWNRHGVHKSIVMRAMSFVLVAVIALACAQRPNTLWSGIGLAVGILVLQLFSEYRYRSHSETCARLDEEERRDPSWHLFMLAMTAICVVFVHDAGIVAFSAAACVHAYVSAARTPRDPPRRRRRIASSLSMGEAR